MTRAPTFDDLFAAMSAAAAGQSTARIDVPDHAEGAHGDVATRLATAVNVLLEDLASRQRSAERLAERVSILADAARAFSAATEPERLLDSVARRLASVVGEYCIVPTADPAPPSCEPSPTTLAYSPGRSTRRPER